MHQPEKLTPAETANPAEERSGAAIVPVWLVVLFFVAVFVGLLYFDQRSGWFSAQVYSPYRSFHQVEEWQPPSGGPDQKVDGKKVYNMPTCVACHMGDGKGTSGQFPPLAGSEFLKEPEPGRLIRIVLHGISGPLTVNGAQYNNAMVPWKGTLNDQQIADVLTYVRNDWGNTGTPVTPERVKAVREATKTRTLPYTQDEILKVAPTE